jgi:metal-responsive CopG/Arc/MetJ family transcriptional regulator
MITRPPSSVLIAVRLPAPMVKRLDRFAQEKCATRAEAVRRLLEEPLKQIEPPRDEAA